MRTNQLLQQPDASSSDLKTNFDSLLVNAPLARSAQESVNLASTVNLNSVKHLLPTVTTELAVSLPPAADSISYLSRFSQALLLPVAKVVDLNLDPNGEPVLYSKGFIKTLPLLMRGRTALAGLVLSYAADEAKIGAPIDSQLVDAGLGASKALALKGAFHYFGSRGATPAATGVGLGIVARGTEVGLTRGTYYGEDQTFDPLQGLRRSAHVALNPMSLAFDAATFGASEVLWARMFNWSRGSVWYKPEVRSAITAGTMGLTTGFSFELQRQLSSDKGLSFVELGRQSVIHGTLDAIAGGIAGRQAKSHMRLSVERDSPDAVHRARNTPYQRGEIADQLQVALRDGKFIFDQGIKGLSIETWLGWVKTGDGRYARAIFRPNDGTEAFAHRMQSEIASYGMGKLGFKSNMPVTVARTVEINGKRFPGYIQEMDGSSLADYARLATGYSGGRGSSYQVKNLLTNPAFKDSYLDAWLHRMIAGEWDNHALNMAVHQQVHKAPSVKNIDLGDAFRPAETRLDLIPTPGVRQGYDMINAHLYGTLAGTKLPASKLTSLEELHNKFRTPEGRKELGSLGLTSQQVEGVLGRMQWFIQNGVMPRQREAAFYLHLNDARRWWDRVSGAGKSRASSLLNSIDVPANTPDGRS